jgi:hypothetical protein
MALPYILHNNIFQQVIKHHISLNESIYIHEYINGCVRACVFQYNSGTPAAISTKLGTHMTIYIYVYKNVIYIIYILSIYFLHNSGTPGAILTKLGTHMTIYIILYIYIYKWMCMYVCSSITLERLGRF